MLAPVMKIFRQWFPVCQLTGRPAATIAFLQARFNRCPAGRLDFQSVQATIRLLQQPLRPRRRIILPKLPCFMARMFLKRPRDFRKSLRLLTAEFLQCLEHHPGVARRGQPVCRPSQRLHAFAVIVLADFATDELEDGPQFFNFFPHPVDGRWMITVPQLAARLLDALVTHASHRLARRFCSFELKWHGDSKYKRHVWIYANRNNAPFY